MLNVHKGVYLDLTYDQIIQVIPTTLQYLHSLTTDVLSWDDLLDIGEDETSDQLETRISGPGV